MGGRRGVVPSVYFERRHRIAFQAYGDFSEYHTASTGMVEGTASKLTVKLSGCRCGCAGLTQKHSLISSSYKIKTYWNILTKLVATVS